VGARHEEKGPRLSYARGAVVAAARAHDRLPLVVAEPLELLELSHHGFAGAILPDAKGAVTANGAFTPTAAERARAEAVVATFDAGRSEGGWVARLGDEVVDSHAARKARQILD
jgi:citrate lyase beta subunit